MDIKLYYVEGISKEDTPYFSTIGEQETYFEAHLVPQGKVESTWYPPYYKNEIKFATNVLNVNTQANYLSFDYNGKEYYYFIRAIHYKTQDVISVEIEMDTIQTFMFDYSLTSAVIERKHINRWIKRTIGLQTKWYLNREYLRENVSRGDFLYKSCDYLTTDTFIGRSSSNTIIKHKGYIAVTKTDKWKNEDDKYASLVFNNGSMVARNSTYLYLIPVISEVSGSVSGNTPVATLLNYHVVGQPTYVNATESFNTLRTDPDSIEIHYIPGNPIKVTYSYIPDEIQLSYNYEESGVVHSAYTKDNITRGALVPNAYGIVIKPVIFDDLLDDKIDIQRNLSIGVAYDYRYETSLLDENYYRVEFGENNTKSSYPLYQLRTTILKGLYYTDILQGYRYYQLIDQNENDELIYDYRNTMVKTPSPLYMDCANDTWKTWLANNRGTMLIAGLDVGVQGAKGFVDGYINSGGNALMGAGNSAYGMWQAAKGTARKMINAYYAPDTLKSSGNIATDMVSHNGDIHFSVYEVDDIEQVAHFYQRYGNLVNEYIETEDNLFGRVNTRYYFNYVKLATCDVHLTGYLEAETITNSIKDRLIGGVRLWNVSVTSLCNYQYDNVEKAFI